jgi:hypothetical protein
MTPLYLLLGGKRPDFKAQGNYTYRQSEIQENTEDDSDQKTENVRSRWTRHV